MRLMDNPIRPYAWGSRTAIAQLQGRPAPTPEPEAELWMGAHPSGPSRLGDDGPLTKVIQEDPAGVLGASNLHRFGPRLPFLLKVLAAAAPLSLQAHPNADQALAGLAAEEAAGVPRDAPSRNYVDAYHKPEMLVAVEDFDALCGFRDPAASAELLDSLGVPALKSTVDALSTPHPTEALRLAVCGLLMTPEAERAPLIEAVAAAAGSRWPLAVELAEGYPSDIGVLVALLLNQVRLAPGEAVRMPPGNLHAYLRGVGVEVMAASDNVLRGGLTPKHVDVPELLRILRFEVLSDPVVPAEPAGPGLATWPSPAAEFVLHRGLVEDGAEVILPGTGPRIVLCLHGEVRVDDGAGEVTLRGGESAFGGAGARRATVAGTGEVFQASTP
jgi:mannose-6-phosphate isomerase